MQISFNVFSFPDVVILKRDHSLTQPCDKRVMASICLKRIISGGQTGLDRAAMDVGIKLEILKIWKGPASWKMLAFCPGKTRGLSVFRAAAQYAVCGEDQGEITAFCFFLYSLPPLSTPWVFSPWPFAGDRGRGLHQAQTILV